MTKPISRKMAVRALLYRFITGPVVGLWSETQGHVVYHPVCGECGGIIFPEHDIQFDHIHADVHGGPHEYQNLRPIHYDPCHKKKSAKDVAANAKVKRIRAGGRKKRGPRLQSRGFQQASRPFPKRRKPSASKT